MTTASATMSERLLDLEDIIRPIAIEETRRYLDSRNLVTKEHLDSKNFVTKEYLDSKNFVTKEYLDERLDRVEERLNSKIEKVDLKLGYGIKDVKKFALIQTGIVVAATVSLLITIAVGVSTLTAAIQAKPAAQTEAPSTQTR